MSFPVTALYAGVLALLYVVLSVMVIRERRLNKVSLGHGGNPTLERCIRGHSNFGEYVPMMLLLLMLAEAQQAPVGWLYFLGGIVVMGRLLHAWAFFVTVKSPLGRTGGTACTLTSLILLGITCLVFAV